LAMQSGCKNRATSLFLPDAWATGTLAAKGAET
jgi:hypothetical protein